MQEFSGLVRDGRVVMLGPIRQEILSGIRLPEQYQRLREKLGAFPDLALDHEDYETAALYFNTCRAKGVQGSNTDFLICAAANRRNLTIFTPDRDFRLYRRHVGIRLHEVD